MPTQHESKYYFRFHEAYLSVLTLLHKQNKQTTKNAILLLTFSTAFILTG